MFSACTRSAASCMTCTRSAAREIARSAASVVACCDRRCRATSQLSVRTRSQFVPPQGHASSGTRRGSQCTTVWQGSGALCSQQEHCRQPPPHACRRGVGTMSNACERWLAAGDASMRAAWHEPMLGVTQRSSGGGVSGARAAVQQTGASDSAPGNATLQPDARKPRRRPVSSCGDISCCGVGVVSRVCRQPLTSWPVQLVRAVP